MHEEADPTRPGRSQRAGECHPHDGDHGSGPAKRRCRACQCQLSLYNTDELCWACSRRQRNLPDDLLRVPVHVWTDPDLQEALADFDFGRVSRLLRKQWSIRQQDLAVVTGLSQSFLSMLESGERRLTNIDRIVDFVDGLGIPTELVRVPRRLPASSLLRLDEHIADAVEGEAPGHGASILLDTRAV